MKTPRAFTLIELSMALIALGFIAVTTTMLFSTYVALIKHGRIDATLIARARTAYDFVADDIRVSGQLNRAGAAAIIEENCAARGSFPACGGTDRLTLIQPNPDYRACRVVAEPSAGRVQISMRAPFAPPSTPACCFAEVGFSRQAVFVTATGAARPVLVTSDAATVGTCTFAFADIFTAPADSLVNAQAILSDVKTFYFEPGAAADEPGRLVMHMELDGAASLAGERLYFADNVVDFQVARAGGAAATDVTQNVLVLSILVALPDSLNVSGSASTPGTRLSAAKTLNRSYVYREASGEVALRVSR